MAFNIEGALSGAGQGLVASASFLKDKYDRDFKAQQSNLEFARKTHLEELRQKNNMSTATTQREWNQEDAKTQRGYATEDRDAKFQQQKDLTDYQNQGALDLATKKSEIKGGEGELKGLKLKSEIALNLAKQAKTLQETANLKNSKPEEINSKAMELAFSSVMSQEGIEEMSVGDQMAQASEAYKVLVDQGATTDGAVSSNQYSEFMNIYYAASQGNKKAEKKLKTVLEGGKVPNSLIQTAQKITNFNPNSLFQNQPEEKTTSGYDPARASMTGALDTSMSGPPAKVGKAKLPVPKDYNSVDWSEAQRLVDAEYGNSRGSGTAYKTIVEAKYKQMQKRK